MEELNTKNTQNFTNSQDNDEMQFTIADIWSIFVKNKWWMVAGVVVCLIVACFHLYRTPSLYTRSAKLIVDESQQDAAVRNLSSFTGGGMRLRNTVAVENEMEAFTSPDLMEMVVERNNLNASYTEHQILRTVELYKNCPIEMIVAGDNPKSSFSFLVKKTSDDSFLLSKFKVGKDKLEGSVEGRLNDTINTPAGRLVLVPTVNIEEWKDDISISWVNSMARAKSLTTNLTADISSKESTVLVLSYKDKFPSRAENILSSLIDVYNEVWLFDKNKAARNTSSFITDRLAIIENELGGIESKLKSFKSENNFSDIKAVAQQYLEESSTYAGKLFEVNNKLSIAGFIKEYLNDPTHQTDLIPSNLGIMGNGVDSQIAEYNKLILQRDRYMNVGSANPLVADVNTAIASLRSAILRSTDNLIATLSLEAASLQEQEDQILRRISSSSGQEYELLSMQRQQKVKESLYIFLLQKREENEITALVNVGNTRIIMRPNGSPGPVSPKRSMILLMAIILGIGIPFAWFFLRIYLDMTVKTRDDLIKLRVPFLAEVPLSKKVKKKKFLKKSKN